MNSLLLTLLFYELFKKPPKFRAEIEGSEPLHALSNLHLEEGGEEAVDGEDDEDVQVRLSTLVVTEMNKVDLSTGYKSVGDGIVYNEEWDEMAKLKKGEKEESEIEKGEVEKSEIGIDEMDQSEVEESDHFEDCE